MDDFEIELKQDFLVESADLLEAAEDAFLRLEDERENAELLNEIFRLAHNLKGTSKAVGFDQLSELTHIAENLILKLKEGSMEVSDIVVSALLEFKDKVVEMVDTLKDDIDATFEIEELQNKLAKITNGEAGSESISEEVVEESLEEAVSMDEVPSADAFDSEGDDFIEEVSAFEESIQDESKNEESVEVPGISAAALESLRESGVDPEALKEMTSQMVTEPEKKSDEVGSTPSASKEPKPKVVSPAPSNNTATKAKPKTDAEESIRVKLSRIDKINNIVGELVILQTVISQRRYEYIKDDLVNKSVGMMGKLFKEVQEIAMSLRMLPLKSTFQKMNRIVRDTSKELDKKVKLHMVGEETEVDKTVLEKLGDPLVHIIRNAVDHGLEDAETRVAQGKTEEGNVELMAYHEGSNLVIQVTDDGKGIDPEIIRQKAIEKRVISEGSTMSGHEILQLIFHPGFSTKEQVTEVSGRGVGMDVVKTNIESLGGEVDLMSKVGQGSSFKIVLPLTLAIIEGLVVSSDEEKFVIPLSQVFEISQVKVKDVESFSGVAKLFKLRGEVLPLFFLNSKMGQKIPEADGHTVIVVRGLSHAFGVVVDDIINQQQIVIKKLGEDIRDNKGVMGSAIMSDGMPSLIIDLYELFKSDLKSNKSHKKLKEKRSAAA